MKRCKFYTIKLIYRIKCRSTEILFEGQKYLCLQLAVAVNFIAFSCRVQLNLVA